MTQMAELKDKGSDVAEARDIRDRILTDVARNKLTIEPPAQVGGNHFYEVASGWEVAIFQIDRHVRKANSASHLQSLMDDDNIRTIIVPADSNIGKEIVTKICSRAGQGKSVFYEVSENE